MIKKISPRALIILIFGISFLYALPTYNKFWFPFDEGMTLACTNMVMHGGIPYKDFVTPFGPAQFYILSFLFTVFGAYLETAHIYIIFLHASICTMIFYLAYRLCRNKMWALFVWVVGVASLAPRIGSTAWSIWPFIFFNILSVVFFVFFIERERFVDVIAAGLSAGMAALCRYELGLYFIISEIAIIVLMAFLSPKHQKARLYLALPLYIFCILILPLGFLFYLWKNGAIKDFLYSVSLPYTVIIKYGETPFPAPCFDLRRIFYGSLAFITINQHYIPILAYIASAPAAIYLYARKKIDAKKMTTLLFITISGAVIFPYAYFGADVTHTMPVIFPALILSAFILETGVARKSDYAIYFKIFIKIFSYVILLLLVLLSIKNTDKYIKNVLTKPFKGDILLLETRRGNVYVPKAEKEDVDSLIKFIDSNSLATDKIFMGFDSHKEISHGGEPMIYFLADRLPSTKYFIMFPGVADQEKTQKEIIASLRNVKLIALSSEGRIVVESAKGRAGSDVLDRYIREHYRPVKKIGNYTIYLVNE